MKYLKAYLIIFTVLFTVAALAANYTRHDDVIIKGTASIGSNTTPDSKAVLDVSSTTKGLLPPRMTTTQQNAITSPTEGLFLYDNVLHLPSFYNGSAWKNYVDTSTAQTLQNKTLDNTNTITLKDTLFTIQDDGDTTKQVKFQASGLTTSTTRTFTFPDATTTFVGTDATQTLTNKTLGVTNSVTLKDNSFTLQDDGDVTKQFVLQLSGITTGTTRTWTVPNTSDTFVGTTGTQTLTNKTLTQPVIDIVSATEQGSSPSTPSSGSKLIYCKTDDKCYTKNSAGSEVLLGAGTSAGLIGDRELIPNTDLESAATGYAAYADAAGTTPVDGTGGSPNTTCARTTSSPITGTGSLLITKSGSANRQGEGCSITSNTFSTADLLPTIMQIEFDYKVMSGTFTAGSDGTSPTDSDYEVYLYDTTNAQIVQPSKYKLYSNTQGHFKGNFQSNTSATTYRLIFHNATTTTNNFTLALDNISIHPAKTGGSPSLNYGPVAYTPTFSAAWGTVSNVSFFHERKGRMIHVYGTFSVGTRAASIATMTLPSGLSLDSSVLPSNTTSNPGQIIGRYQSSESASNSGGNVVTAAGTSTSLIYFATASTNAGSHVTPANGDAVTASSVSGSIDFWAPISQWNGSDADSSAASGVVIASRAHVSSGSSTSSGNPFNFDTVDYDFTNSITTGASWKYTAPYSGLYMVCVDYYVGAGGVNGAIYKNGSIYAGVENNDSDPGSGCTTVVVKAGDTIDFRPVNAAGTPSSLTGVSTAQLNYIDIFLVQGAAQSGGGSGLISGTAVATTSGTSIDISGIPGSAKRVTLIFNGVSTNGTTVPQIQLGTSAGNVTTGYTVIGTGFGSGVSSVAYTTGFSLGDSAIASNTLTGSITFRNISGSTWVGDGMMYRSSSPTGIICIGNVTLSGVLDHIHLHAGGTDTFDAGSINITYE